MFREIRVIHAKGHLEIQPETADIQIDRTEQGDFPVNHDAFGVQQSSLKRKNTDSRGQHIIEIGTAGIVNQTGIVALRHNDRNPDPPLCGSQKGGADRLVRDEIGGGHNQFTLGRIDGQEQQLINRAAGPPWA